MTASGGRLVNRIRAQIFFWKLRRWNRSWRRRMPALNDWVDE